ncbi:hypothetical protein HUJ04_003249 [Dendroctonus ponderosae]|nr:hypothetical protein HUJ04_003249 [Dendroctonus ponderosae]
MFDPLGFVSPAVVCAKLLMQRIWVRKLCWDDELPTDLKENWKTNSRKLSDVSHLKISRWVFESKDISEIQIHVFSDASMVAYGACIYIRAIYEDKSVSSNFLCSKSRIAPIKTVSLPRLELCGALLHSRLVHRVVPALQLKIGNVFLWTDSTIVLCWLRGTPNRWTTFVANRIAEMQELTSTFTWNHVGSKENPADCISRGISVSEIMDKHLWWHGPNYLLEFNNDFSNNGHPDVTVIPEQKEMVAMTQTVVENVIKSNNFSNFLRLHRAVSYCHTFLKRSSEPLSNDDLQQAHDTIMKQIQLESFEKEIKQLQSSVNLQASFKDSHIACLNPFLDEKGILRVNDSGEGNHYGKEFHFNSEDGQVLGIVWQPERASICETSSKPAPLAMHQKLDEELSVKTGNQNCVKTSVSRDKYAELQRIRVQCGSTNRRLRLTTFQSTYGKL